MSDPSRVVVSGPLSAFAPGFLDELLGQGYRPGTAVFLIPTGERARRQRAARTRRAVR
jgi:hypothetical protein